MAEYVANNQQSYAICQFCDVHQDFQNDPNFIEYHKGDLKLSRMLFLGDMVNAFYTSTMENAVNFIKTAVATRRIVCIGNHEYQYYSGSGDGPDKYFRQLIDSNDVAWNYANSVVYYSDDSENNVRYIVLDCHYDTQDINVYRLPLEEIAWIAEVLQASEEKDIVFCNHCPIYPYIPLSAGTEIDDEDVVANINEYFVPLVNAYQNRTAYSLEIDGVTYSYDFANCSGSVICYTCGHYHTPGYSNIRGFNMFTGPSKRNDTGISFFVVDREKQKILWYICPESTEGYTLNEYDY